MCYVTWKGQQSPLENPETSTPAQKNPPVQLALQTPDYESVEEPVHIQSEPKFEPSKPSPKTIPSVDSLKEPTPSNPFSPDAPTKTVTSAPMIDLEHPFGHPNPKLQHPAELSVELIRLQPDSQTDEQFLVTSLGVSQEPALNETEKGSPPALFPDGWIVLRKPANEATDVLPTNHHVKSATISVPISLTLSASTRWEVAAPQLHCEIESASRVRIGNFVPLRIRITNTGNAPAENVVLHVDLPKSLAYRLGRKLEHQIGTLQPGKTHIARLTPRCMTSGNATMTFRVINEGNQATKTEHRVEVVR
ncbi:MAG: hypothetical protein Tsb009_15930 [Planctomycetaceae bacterium]